MADLGFGTVSGTFWIPGSMLLGGGIGVGDGGIGSAGRPGTGGVGFDGTTSAATARLDIHMMKVNSIATLITSIFNIHLMRR